MERCGHRVDGKRLTVTAHHLQVRAYTRGPAADHGYRRHVSDGLTRLFIDHDEDPGEGQAVRLYTVPPSVLFRDPVHIIHLACGMTPSPMEASVIR